MPVFARIFALFWPFSVQKPGSRIRWGSATLLALALSAPLPAQEWTPADTKREIAWQLLNLADWSQTRQFKDQGTYSETWDQSASCWRWKRTEVVEMNPFLGEHPSPLKTNRYFALGALLHVGASIWFDKHRATFQYITIGFSAGIVANNEFVVGVHMGF